MGLYALGARLRAARALREWSLRDLADCVGCHYSTLDRYENGLISRPSFCVLQLCAYYLGVSYVWLAEGWLPACADEDENAWLIDRARGAPCPIVRQVNTGM